MHHEAAVDVCYLIFDQLTAVADHFGLPRLPQLRRGHPVPGQETVHVCGRSVTRGPAVHNRHPTPGAGQHERGVQPGRARANYHHVKLVRVHPDHSVQLDGRVAMISVGAITPRCIALITFATLSE